MSNILINIQSAENINNICQIGALAAKNLQQNIALLHIAKPHSENEANIDLSGAIGLGAKKGLLDKLTQIDEKNGKEEQKKGKLILENAKNQLAELNIENPETLHLRGSLVETISQLEEDFGLIIIDKSEVKNIENLARSTKKPILISTTENLPIEEFLIAFDGSDSSKRAIDYLVQNPLLKGTKCHLLKIGQPTGENEEQLKIAKEKLEESGFAVISNLEQSNNIEEKINNYVSENNIDLLVIVAYEHSKIRSFFLGSTTSDLIKNSDIPLLLFR